MKSSTKSSGSQINFSKSVTKSDTTFFGYKTHIKILHGENRFLLLNTLCTCMTMLNYLKQKLDMSRDDNIDLIDFDGHLKELPNDDNRNYAVKYLTPTISFAVVKIDIDSDTEEKHFTCMLNESKQSGKITKKLSTLNTASKERARQIKETRLKLQQSEENFISNGRSSSSRSKGRNRSSSSSSNRRQAI